MDITHLEYFREAARQATGEEAARALGIAPEELARALEEFEAEWGEPLFEGGAGGKAPEGGAPASEGGEGTGGDGRPASEGGGGGRALTPFGAEVLASSEPLVSAYRAFKQHLAHREPSA